MYIDNDPMEVEYLFSTGSACGATPDSDYDAHGHYSFTRPGQCSQESCSSVISTYENPLHVKPVPGIKEAKTLQSVEWGVAPRITGNVCTTTI